jgi:hypothetical protein
MVIEEYLILEILAGVLPKFNSPSPRPHPALLDTKGEGGTLLSNVSLPVNIV